MTTVNTVDSTQVHKRQAVGRRAHFYMSTRQTGSQASVYIGLCTLY